MTLGRTHETPPLGLDFFHDYALQESRLRIGTLRWGYNHIRPQHGWDVAVRQRVEDALLNPIHLENSGSAWAYYSTFISSTHGGILCSFKVVVDYGPRSQLVYDPFFIITAYAKKGLVTPPW
jgi:hypothetical protein